MRSLIALQNPRRGIMAPLFLMLSIIDERLQALLISLEIPSTQKEIGKTGYGTVLLMIAFILSTFIIGFGGRLIGIPDIRIRVGVSITFFLFVFVALVVYENLMRRWG